MGSNKTFTNVNGLSFIAVKVMWQRAWRDEKALWQVLRRLEVQIPKWKFVSHSNLLSFNDISGGYILKRQQRTHRFRGNVRHGFRGKQDQMFTFLFCSPPFLLNQVFIFPTHNHEKIFQHEFGSAKFSGKKMAIKSHHQLQRQTWCCFKTFISFVFVF